MKVLSMTMLIIMQVMTRSLSVMLIKFMKMIICISCQSRFGFGPINASKQDQQEEEEEEEEEEEQK